MTPLAVFWLAGALVLANYGVDWPLTAAAFALGMVCQAAPAFRGITVARRPSDEESGPLPPGYGGQPIFPIAREHHEPQ